MRHACVYMCPPACVHRQQVGMRIVVCPLPGSDCRAKGTPGLYKSAHPCRQRKKVAEPTPSISPDHREDANKFKWQFKLQPSLFSGFKMSYRDWYVGRIFLLLLFPPGANQSSVAYFLNKLPYYCIVRPSDNWPRIVRERKKLCSHDKCAGWKSGWL